MIGTSASASARRRKTPIEPPRQQSPGRARTTPAPDNLIPYVNCAQVADSSLSLFIVGSLLYFVSWVPLMIVPQSPWSTSWLGFVAPANTPLVWLAGLGLIGRRLYVPSPFRWWMYVGLACGFVIVHVSHVSIVYTRTFQLHAAVEATARSLGRSASG